MEKTWRWFGKKDKITLSMLRQIGVEGIVTALHDIPNGEIWPYEAVAEMRDYVAAAGLRWSVVESLPVSESIKYGGPDRDRLIENYIVSLANLARPVSRRCATTSCPCSTGRVPTWNIRMRTARRRFISTVRISPISIVAY